MTVSVLKAKSEAELKAYQEEREAAEKSLLATRKMVEKWRKS